MSRFIRAGALALALIVPVAVSTDAGASGTNSPELESVVRFATYNASLNRANEGELGAALAAPGDAQAAAVAEIIQRTRPEVLLLNEFDYDPQALADFQTNYLGVPQGGAAPIEYGYSFIAPSNTGVYSGFDYDNSGAAGDFPPNDSYGFGFFPGQFGMAVLSQYPIDLDGARTFQNFAWKDMPGALLPDDDTTPEPGDYYTPGPELDSFRLSSKSHWDLPIEIGSMTVHFLVSHPTPPVFDGPEDRNGLRNHDEIRFWADYVHPSRRVNTYIYDDAGGTGGLPRGAKFVIAGDQNADPFDGDSVAGAAQQLIDHPMIRRRPVPASVGGVEQAALQGEANDTHIGDPANDTADFGDADPGNLRVDYVLARKGLNVVDSGVFWPAADDPTFPLVAASDHRLTWIDIRSPRFRR